MSEIMQEEGRENGDEYEDISLYMCKKFPKCIIFNGALRLGEQCNQQPGGQGVRKTKVPVN